MLLSPDPFYLFMPFSEGKFCRKTIINFPCTVKIWFPTLVMKCHTLVFKDNEILLAQKYNIHV
jgi:hypothetical protein